jgi:5-(carboxyamino)imidazole ribonucleotide mutase
MTEEKVVIIMGSGSDEEFSDLLCESLEKLGIKYERRVASAHKTPQKLLKLLREYERSKDRIVYITVAGGSNALSGFVDANTICPVIACPPYSKRFGGLDLYSSLRMPSGVSPLVILKPENAALAAVKILALGNSVLSKKVLQYHQSMMNRVDRDDERLRTV